MGCGSSSEVPSRPGFSFRHEGHESDVKAKRAAHAAMLLRHHGPKNLMAREALFLLTELYSCKTDVQLGEGAFGSVFTAQRHSDRKEFAVEMALFSSNSREDLLEEIKIQASLDHPNIVRIIESFDNKTGIFVMMEL